jgi:RNA polymerase sigma factor (sigma-70 family)
MPGFTYRREEGSFRSYLYRVVKSKVADYWTAKGRRPPHTELIPEVHGGVDDSSIAIWDREYDRHLLEVILGRVHRDVDDELSWRVFRLYFQEDRTAKEIAEELGITEGVVVSRAWRIMHRLREVAREIAPERT